MHVVGPGTPPVVGIDFGTTNSSIAWQAEGGAIRVAEFETIGPSVVSSRSVMYFERNGARSNKAGVWTGPEAVQRYLSKDLDSDEIHRRLIQSLKSYLSARSFSGTEIFGRIYRVEDLIATILTDLRLRASASLGFDITSAIVGRPVWFVGANTDADNDFAVSRLTKSFMQAGFTKVKFVYEPVAAAFSYGSNAGARKNVLVGDFGGGTTDFSLVNFGPAGSTVLASTGVGLAGDAFDAKIVRHLISPALGLHSMGREVNKVLPVLPAWIYANLERWHTLSFLRTRNVVELLRTAHKRALEPEKIKLLQDVIETDLGYAMHQAVQRLKVKLSSGMEADFTLRIGNVDLTQRVTRAEFEGWITPELGRISQGLDSVLAAAAMSPADVTHVFLTGGTSLVPAVRRVFGNRFGEDRVESGDAFTSVARGLAMLAAEHAPP